MKYFLSLAILATSLSTGAQGVKNEILLKTAEGHPMQYYVSLPEGWTSKKKWPIVIAIEAAEKQFEENAKRFTAARGKMPFIIVSPIIVTNGNQGQKDPKIYPYSKATWDLIDKIGVCAFDTAGLAQVIKGVQKMYGGEEKIFVTGFEAGAHLTWAFVFKHPEQLRGAAIIAGNYRSRCMDNHFSQHNSRVSLPVAGIRGQYDSLWSPGGKIYGQWEEAKKLAIDHGYKNISEMTIPNKAHIPLPDEVLAYFSSLKL